jgi:hypothetical protein
MMVMTIVVAIVTMSVMMIEGHCQIWRRKWYFVYVRVFTKASAADASGSVGNSVS